MPRAKCLVPFLSRIIKFLTKSIDLPSRSANIDWLRRSWSDVVCWDGDKVAETQFRDDYEHDGYEKVADRISRGLIQAPAEATESSVAFFVS